MLRIRMCCGGGQASRHALLSGFRHCWVRSMWASGRLICSHANVRIMQLVLPPAPRKDCSGLVGPVAFSTMPQPGVEERAAVVCFWLAAAGRDCGSVLMAVSMLACCPWIEAATHCVGTTSQ